MLSPTAIALYTVAVLWLAFKYRMLLDRGQRVAGEVCTAAAVGFAVVVVPHVRIGETAWCPDVDIPTVPSIALVVAVAGPLLSARVFPPALAIASALFTLTYLCQTQCWGVATIVAGAGIVHAMLYIYDLRQQGQQEQVATRRDE
tara:strand:- start:5108 stop:5542 length:435 start_codon:yes stop_codon:yes gene_type:complete